MICEMYNVLMKSEVSNTNYVEWISRRPSFAVTLTFNWHGDIAPRSAFQCVKLLGRRIDELRLGSRYYKKPVESRSLFVFVPEKWGQYPHYHGVFQMPCPKNGRAITNDYAALIRMFWSDIVPAGTADVQDLYDPDGWLSYMTKETPLSDDAVVFAHDHWSVRQ